MIRRSQLSALATGSENETIFQSFERLNLFNKELVGKKTKFNSEFYVYSVSFQKSVASKDILGAEKRLGISLPQSYIELVTEIGIPILDYKLKSEVRSSTSFPKALVFAPKDLRFLISIVDSKDDLMHVKREEKFEVLQNLGKALAFAKPDDGVSNYFVFGPDNLVHPYKHDLSFHFRKRGFLLNLYFAGIVNKLNREQFDYMPDELD